MLENEFFYLNFSQYIQLDILKNLQHSDLYLIAEIANDYDEFRNKILERGITKPEYRAFIENIRPLMENLNKIRNCVAHNRSLSEDDGKNYERYFNEINQYLDAFFSSLKEN